ncbi:ABC transporter substrate-binding protein [Vagococcus salmoninarum]|uniref:ABC transporter substrate-binding protein n=1 Tax=Vagococcus salmoninarum TaxID=2739 RepID=UPI001880E82A|nr:extracellular solute-binding protein [Vagococcus salmoninarum]MBE9389348.1 extracellular solute-binding protein [Vagococcus salmoninarum]
MKKSTLVMLAAGLLLMAGCSSGKKGNKEETAKPGEPVTIKIANYALLESGYTEYWEGIEKKFTDKYPEIKIEWITAPYGEITNQVINMAGGGDRVDIVFGENSWVPTYEDAGLAVPITDVLSEEFLADFYDNALEANRIGDDIYAVPLYMSPYMLYYNKDIFKQAGLDPENPPKTYDEMLIASEAISKLKTPEGNKIYAFGQTTASVPISGSSLTSMVYNFGGSILTDDGKINEDTKELEEVVQLLQELDEKGYNPQNSKLKDLRNLFALGQLGMYYDQSWGFNGVRSINEKAEQFTASSGPLKGGKGQGESIIQEQVFILTDNGKERAQATEKFVEFVISKENLEDYMSNITPAYPVKKSMENMPGIVNSPILQGAASSLEKAKATPLIPEMDDLNLELCTLIQAITVSKTPVDKAIKNFLDLTNGMLN